MKSSFVAAVLLISVLSADAQGYAGFQDYNNVYKAQVPDLNQIPNLSPPPPPPPPAYTGSQDYNAPTNYNPQLPETRSYLPSVNFNAGQGNTDPRAGVDLGNSNLQYAQTQPQSPPVLTPYPQNSGPPRSYQVLTTYPQNNGPPRSYQVAAPANVYYVPPQPNSARSQGFLDNFMGMAASFGKPFATLAQGATELVSNTASALQGTAEMFSNMVNDMNNRPRPYPPNHQAVVFPAHFNGQPLSASQVGAPANVYYVPPQQTSASIQVGAPANVYYVPPRPNPASMQVGASLGFNGPSNAPPPVGPVNYQVGVPLGSPNGPSNAPPPVGPVSNQVAAPANVYVPPQQTSASSQVGDPSNGLSPPPANIQITGSSDSNSGLPPANSQPNVGISVSPQKVI